MRMSMVQSTVESIDPSYVLTVDNLLKMLSILLRLKNNTPVCIMGETGTRTHKILMTRSFES